MKYLAALVALAVVVSLVYWASVEAPPNRTATEPSHKSRSLWGIAKDRPIRR